MGVADFVARRAQRFTTGFFAARDQTAIRGEVLPAWEAVDTVDVVESHEAENLADTGDRLE
jgi:hypothetical protein